ncbi:MAG: fibro-slime domain-containing protein [Eubacteriales bacterium]|nr:fibro-slime domain-containing protein [Eubacteriales bacterium]
MKKGLRAKLFAFALALCLCTTMVTPAFAASGRYNSSGNRWSFSNWWNNRWNHDDDNTSDSNKSDSSETKLKLVEDQSTVAEGTELRASTYEVENTDAASNTSTIKYFPVTMYNYDTATINRATHNAEAAKASANGQSSISSWDGMYFSGGNPVNGASNSKYDTSPYLGDNTGKAGKKSYSTETYAKWNYWGANVKNAGYTGNYICSGLVEKSLDTSNNIVFTNTEPGLFRSDDTTNNYGKEIYTNVGLPFQYDETTNYYTFNSNKMSAHFTSKHPAGSNTDLTYDTTPQTITDLSAQGKSDKASWLPFDEGSSATMTSATYHFGMQAVIPFSMTANGKMNAADENSADIKFDFSGDDDVWVFVDGKLVLDIGGIHNEMAGTMNFATNKWTVLQSTDNTSNGTAGDMNSQKMTGKLFNTDSETGVLDTDRETFAATTSHTLTVFYLERGAGASNCKIRFNLPMEDSVSVKKLVSDKDSAGSAISADTQEAINNHEFAFKLFKNGEPLKNTNYIILDESNQPIDTATTAKDGTFKLKNKQTAKFVGQIPDDGNTYYVQEAEEDGWQTPSSSYTATAANGSEETGAANGATSAKVLIRGSNEANDQLNYTFTNVLTHVDKTTIQPQDDKIVIDYGLPVEIDPLANDVVQNGTKSIKSVTGAQFGEATIRGNKIIYTLNKQLTDVETLTYTVKATASTEADSKTAEAKIYIIPATSMYYEENFSDMAKFSASWTNEGTSGTVYQEPGVVGTPNDSPYGSDNAYMNSSGDSYGDSCGTSKYVSTADGRSKTFKYTFTGKGTSFFARTNSNSGYMRVRVTDEAGTVLHTLYRNTKYKADGELYNIPVFTWNAEKYGTYTVTVTVSRPDKAGSYGTEFWVDGIRVMNPMNPESKNLTIAQDAYAADGESNMTFATLRNALLADTTENQNGELVWDTSKGFVVFTDSNDTITSASEYKSDGPKEEVYLAKDQRVSFSLADWDADTNHLYLGIKAPMGAGTVQLGSKTINVNNTVDCYYDAAQLVTISQKKDTDGTIHKVATLTITNPSDSIISLTNIKVTGKSKFVIIPVKDTNDVNPDGSDE